MNTLLIGLVLLLWLSFVDAGFSRWNAVPILISANHGSKSISNIKSDNGQESKRENFFRNALAGAISCSLTHSLLVPVDVIKTRLQTDANLAKLGIIAAVQSILKSQGFSAFSQGLAATSSGYFMQGACKFGFYGMFKQKIHDQLEKVNVDARAYKFPILLASSGLAEILACWALCPLESTRIFMVINADISKKGIFFVMQTIFKNEGIMGFYKGMWAMLFRQVPYTAVKLTGYDMIVERLNKAVTGEVLPTHPGVQLCSGICAGVLAAVISQPADVLISCIYGGLNSGANQKVIDGPRAVLAALRSIGLQSCFAGMLPRAVMVGSMTALQFLIFEQMKQKIRTFGMSKNTTIE